MSFPLILNIRTYVQALCVYLELFYLLGLLKNQMIFGKDPENQELIDTLL